MNTLLEDPRTDALAFLARVHGAPDLAREQPLVFGPDAPGRTIVLGEGGEPRSACTILARDFVLPDGRVRVGLIGSVATEAEHRGRGLATGVLVQAEAELHAQGCALVILWADDPEFYLRRGYTPVGSELDFRVGRECIRSLPRASGARRLRPADAAAVHALYERHPARVARTAAETESLLACPGMETLVLEREGRVAAYACCGRGRDLHDTIHEWGGETSLVLALVRAHLERRFGEGMSDAHGSLFLMAPAGEQKLAAALVAAGATRAEGILALGRVLDPVAVALLLEERLGAGARVAVVPRERGPSFDITGPADRGELDAEGALALLVGTGEVRAQVAGFLARFGFASPALPIEPFAFGLDSI